MLLLTTIQQGGESHQINYPLKEFIYNNYLGFFVVCLILFCLVIALATFLALLWRYYKKDELILRKYKIDPSNEDDEELKKYDQKI